MKRRTGIEGMLTYEGILARTRRGNGTQRGLS